MISFGIYEGDFCFVGYQKVDGFNIYVSIGIIIFIVVRFRCFIFIVIGVKVYIEVDDGNIVVFIKFEGFVNYGFCFCFFLDERGYLI